MLRIFAYNQKHLKDFENKQIHFHVHDLYGNRKIKHEIVNHEIFIDPYTIIFDKLVTIDEKKITTSIDAILSKMTKHIDEKTLMHSFMNFYQKNTKGVHDVCFAQVTFSIVGEAKWQNNFVCIVPIVNNHENGFDISPAFHGALWELTRNERRCYFISSFQESSHTNDDFKFLKQTFDNRTVMEKGYEVIKPFISISNRDKPGINHKKNEEFLIQEQDMFTYISKFYGMYVSIGMSQECMVEQELPFDIIDSIVKDSLNYMGFSPAKSICEHGGFSLTNFADTKCVADIFFSIICYCMMRYNLGIFEYRADLLGEDIDTRFVDDGKVSIFLFIFFSSRIPLTINTYIC